MTYKGLPTKDETAKTTLRYDDPWVKCFCLLMASLMIWQIEKTSLTLHGFMKIKKQPMYTFCVQYSTE